MNTEIIHYFHTLSKDDESYTKTQNVLNSIKNKLNKEEHDSELFYINIFNRIGFQSSSTGFLGIQYKSSCTDSGSQ